MPASTSRPYPASNDSMASTAYVKTPEDRALLAKVAELLVHDQPAQALEAIRRVKPTTPWTKNAIGVCQLRLKNPKPAIELYRELVLEPGGILVRAGIPTVFQTNFATALLLDHNLTGGMKMVQQLSVDRHPAVARLTAALENWKQNLSWWQRLNWQLGGEPNRPLSLKFPPGDLE